MRCAELWTTAVERALVPLVKRRETLHAVALHNGHAETGGPILAPTLGVGSVEGLADTDLRWSPADWVAFALPLPGRMGIDVAYAKLTAAAAAGTVAHWGRSTPATGGRCSRSRSSSARVRGDAKMSSGD